MHFATSLVHWRLVHRLMFAVPLLQRLIMRIGLENEPARYICQIFWNFVLVAHLLEGPLLGYLCLSWLQFVVLIMGEP